MTRSARLAAPIALVTLACGGPIAAQPVGLDVQLNATTADDQLTNIAAGSIALAAGGGFVAAWMSDGQDGDGRGIFARRFADDGEPLSAEIPVNVITAGAQQGVSVVVGATGEMLFTWFSPDGDSSGIVARLFDADGSPLTGEIPVNESVAGPQSWPHATRGADDGYVVVWQDATADGRGFGVAARRISDEGALLGDEIVVNAVTSGDQTLPRVASDATGAFVVGWTDDSQDGSGTGVRLRRFQADGQPVGGEIAANTTTSGDQRDVAVAMTADGSFAAAWASDGQDGSGTAVAARAWSSSGTAVSNDFVVNQTTAGSQEWPSLGHTDDDVLVVAWQGPGTGADVLVRRLETDGTAVTDEEGLSFVTSGDQAFPVVALREDGPYVASWDSFGQDGSGFGVFAHNGFLIFRDGFESGDTTSWDSTVD